MFLWHQERSDVACVLCVCANFIGRNQQKPGGDDDYNIDENEAESERDKQAALAGNDKSVNGENWGGVGHFHVCLVALHLWTDCATTPTAVLYVIAIPGDSFSSEAFECRGTGGSGGLRSPSCRPLGRAACAVGSGPQESVGVCLH